MFNPDDQSQAFRIGEKFGELVGLLIVSLPAAACLQRAVKTPSGSRRYAWLSAFLGLLVLSQVELLLDSRNSPGGVFLSGVTRTLIGSAGGILALRSLLARGKDHQVGWLGPCVAGLLCGLHVLVGLFMLTLPKMTATGEVGDSWVYHSDADGYSITLPTKRWSPVNLKGASSAFRCKEIASLVGVFVVSETPEAHSARLRQAREKELAPLQDLKTETGKTSAGHEYFMAEGVEKNGDKGVRVRQFFVYRPERNQTLILIGEFRSTMSSEMGQSTQMAASEVAQRSIMMSIH